MISRTRAAGHLCWARLHWAAAVADLGRHDEAEARFAELLEGTHAPEDEALVRFDRGAARCARSRSGAWRSRGVLATRLAHTSPAPAG